MFIGLDQLFALSPDCVQEALDSGFHFKWIALFQASLDPLLFFRFKLRGGQ
jgi:hypothetical protein